MALKTLVFNFTFVIRGKKRGGARDAAKQAAPRWSILLMPCSSAASCCPHNDVAPSATTLLGKHPVYMHNPGRCSFGQSCAQHFIHYTQCLCICVLWEYIFVPSLCSSILFECRLFLKSVLYGSVMLHTVGVW